MVSSSETTVKRIEAQREDAGSSAAQRSIRLTARDGEILDWLARYRLATAEQIGRRFHIGRVRTYARLGDLFRGGYVVRERPVFAFEAGAYVATRAGLAVARSPLPPGKLDVRTLRHDLGLVDLGTELELRGLEVRTERELRHRHGARGAPDSLAVELPSGNGGRHHFPDLLVIGEDGQRFAIELELTPKRTDRLERILRGYRRASEIAAIRYYVEQPALAARIDELGRSLRMEDRLDVRPWRGGVDGD